MSDLIELPTPHTDPLAQDRYRRERAALASDSAMIAHRIEKEPDADTLKATLGLP